MPEATASRRSLREQKVKAPGARKPRFYKRWWFWLIVGIVLVVAAVASFSAYIGTRALEAKTQLETAQGLIGTMKTQAVALDFKGASETYESIGAHTSKAVELTSDPLWMAGESIPWAGANLKAVRELAAVTDHVVTGVVAPLMEVASGLDPSSITPKNGAIDLQPLIDAVPAVSTSYAGLTDVMAEADAIETDGTIDQIVAARAKIVGLLEPLKPLLEEINQVLPLVAPALGSEAPRTYILMFQNPSESRALGGTALSFAVLKMDNGSIQLQETIPAGYGNFSSYENSVLPVPEGGEDLFNASYGRFIANVTVRPSFTSAAELTQEMWFQQFGYRVDGILSIDPVALGYVLGATDPITLSTGDVLNQESLVPLLLNEVYQRYNTGNNAKDNLAQDQVFGEAVSGTFSRFTSGPLKPIVLLNAVIRGWTEHRIMYWTTSEAEKTQLAKLGPNGELPVSDKKTDRVGVYFQDNVGSKMNYYLRQAVHLSQATCRTDGLESYRVVVDLANTIDPATASSLSPSILGQWRQEGVKRGNQRMIVMLYAPPGSTISGATVNGAAVTMEANHDDAYPVGKLVVTVPAGAGVSVAYNVTAATPGVRVLEGLTTPMVNATTVDTIPLDCATVTAK